MFVIQPIHSRNRERIVSRSGPYGHQESRRWKGKPETENACSGELTDESADRFRWRRGSMNAVCDCGAASSWLVCHFLFCCLLSVHLKCSQRECGNERSLKPSTNGSIANGRIAWTVLFMMNVGLMVGNPECDLKSLEWTTSSEIQLSWMQSAQQW